MAVGRSEQSEDGDGTGAESGQSRCRPVANPPAIDMKFASPGNNEVRTEPVGNIPIQPAARR